MKEDLLHFIWKYKKLQLKALVTSKKEVVRIEDTGTHNHLSGPDFFNAKIRIDGQLWAGNVEIHLKSSDWYAHNHERDNNYNNVILHVVWEDDAKVFRSDNSEIPTLELKNYIAPAILRSYQELFDKSTVTFINCEKNIGEIDPFVMQNWLERLYFERLERKSAQIETQLQGSHNNWESVLFSLLLKNFGSKVNGEAFQSMANTLDFSTVRKLTPELIQLESVFYGMAHLLNEEGIVDEYYLLLKNEFLFLEKKFDLNPDSVQKPEFFKLRPPNFPTIRLSQLANLYHSSQNLFAELMAASNISKLYAIFNVSASEYWNTHYTFGKPSKKSSKKLTKEFIDLLILNTILPLKFCHSKHLGQDVSDEIIEIISSLKLEKNSIVQNFSKLKVAMGNAKSSQAVLQLYTEYCTKNKCLHCAVGNLLLGGNH
ncbi:MAG: DUF2851 family protein [Flavobacteriaceae bacterium]